MVQYDPRETLAAAIERVKAKQNLDIANVLEIMSYSRNVIEACNSKTRYPILGLYCDWCLHIELDRSELIHDILALIPLTILSQLDTGLLIRQIGALFAVPTLRKQLRELFQNKKIDTVLFDIRENWALFLWLLIRIIEGKPLKFPETAGQWSNKRAKQKYDQMVASIGIHENFAPECVYFSREEKEGQTSVYVEIKTRGQYFIRAPLVVGEPAESFSE